MGISRIQVPNKEHVLILFQRRLIAGINVLTLNVTAMINSPKLISNVFKLFAKSVLFEADRIIKNRESSLKKRSKANTFNQIETCVIGTYLEAANDRVCVLLQLLGLLQHLSMHACMELEELEEEGYNSNRICIRTKLKTVVFDSFKKAYRGKTCWVRAIEVPGWVPDFEEDGEEGYDVNDGSHEDDMYGGVSENLKDVEGKSDREEVPETNFEEGWKNINDKHEDSLKYPPGFTPNEDGDVPVEKVNNWSDENRVNDGQEDGWEEITYYIGICSSRFKRKKMLWDYLSFVIGNWDGKVVIMGDFNEVRDISERFGSIFNKHGAKAFNSFIVNTGLVEVLLGGCSFTWCHKSAKKMSKLVRFLIFDNLMCSCPSISSTSLDRFLSDHQPIIIREDHYDYGPIPFKFFHYCKFMNKLKYLKEKIRIWARLHKDSLHSRKNILKAELADLDGVIDKGEGSDVDGHQRREVVRLIQEVEKVDVMEVAQKAQIKWSIDGDENSKYYHGVFNKKRGRLTIRGVLVDGIWMESPHLVKHEFFEHFKNRFENPNKSSILLERDFVKKISLEQNDDLEREVSNEEIKRTVWDCGIDKAPGPDGFTFGSIDGANANMVKDFRPISLIGSLYKVIAKVLANRLVTVLDDIVDKIQSAFVTDRQILDGPFILNEIVHWFMESLHVSLQRVVDAGLFNGIKLDSSLQISHLFYADDAIFMGQINMNKSNLMGISVDSNKVKHAAAKIGAIPIYHMSIFKVPMKVLQNMESIRTRFLNGADVNSKKLSWVRWKNVLAAKDVGGLGVVVKALHGEDGKIGKKVQPRYPSTWLNIINEIKSLKLHGIDLVSFITLKLGNGANTSFWDVAWCGDIAFKNLVPKLYALESMKNIRVTSKLSHGGLEFYFRRNPRGGVEQAQFERKLIVNDILPKGILKTRWIKEVPIKINVHALKVIHDCLPTRFNISRRGRSIPLKIGVNGSHPSGSRSKTPGLDGFSFAFVKKYWDVIKVVNLEYVNIFLDIVTLPRASISSFLTLIPKEQSKHLSKRRGIWT
nr:RNA-directed DNA polymerase, eukaryota [Tanacetum cinerariifolium]